jgi:type IV pilus assembly protein PilE
MKKLRNTRDQSTANECYNESGFSLIELMVVVAIMGILVTIAMPAYTESVRRSNRAEAKSELVQVASEQERFFSSTNSYSTDATPLNTPVVAARVRVTTNAWYSIAVTACAGGAITNCFIATATAQNEQLADGCTTFTLTSIGVRGSTGLTSDECWQ